MKITNVAVNNRTSVFILIFLIIIQGTAAYSTLPREAAPEIEIPLLIVSTLYAGVSPADIETLVTQPIEKELKGINSVKEITSSSFESYSVIKVEFEAGYDLDEALQKVRDKVDKAESELPEDAEDPEIIELNISEFPIFNFNISGEVGLVNLKELADDLEEEIERISGVLDAKVRGGMEREVRVDVDINKLLHYNIRFFDIASAIADENQTIPGGSIDVHKSSFLVRIPGEFDLPYIIEDIIVKRREGKPIYVKDVAEVTYDFKDRTTYARANGIDAVSISVSKRTGENIIDVVNEVRKILEVKEAELPETVKINVTTDYSIDIEKQVKELVNNIISGLFLVVGVLFFFLGVRNSMFVAIAIPLSMLISFMVLQFMGVTLNFVVLFALILALGMLVDNAIVIIENIYKFLEEGHGKIEAAKLATAEVAWPVITSTLTTVAAFFPLLFWPGIVGDFMSYIPMTVIITLSASLFVALIINPVVASVFMKVERPGDVPVTWFDKLLHPFNKVTHFFTERALPVTLNFYERFLRFALGRVRGINERISRRNIAGLVAVIFYFFAVGEIEQFLGQTLALIVSLILGTFVVFIFSNMRLRFIWAAILVLMVITQFYFLLDLGVEFFPNTQPNQAYVTLETPTGTNIDASNEKIRKIENKILESDIPDIENMLVEVGATNNPFEAGASTPNKSVMTIQYVDYELREQSSLITTDQIRDLLLQEPGLEVVIDMEQAGPPVGLPVNIEIIGENYNLLGDLAAKVREKIKDVAGLVDINDNYDAGKPELRVEIDREKAILYGLSTAAAAGVIRSAIYGFEASKYRVGEDEYDITVRLREDQRNTIEDLQNLKISFNNLQGKTLNVPLRSIADIKIDKGPGAITRKDLDRVVTVTGDAAEGFNENAVLDSVKNVLADFKLPSGYHIDFTGASEMQEESQDYISRAFMIAVLLIFMILVIQFNSVTQPFIIMTAIMISLIGVFIGLILWKMAFGVVMTGIGIISLVGVVVNNNIVLIDYTNQLREKGMTRREAVITAGMRRFRPVTLTAITTILGLLPLSFGFGFDFFEWEFTFGGESAEFWQSMGIAVIFGLAFATFLTLIIVPIIYSTTEEIPGALKQIGERFIEKIKRGLGLSKVKRA